MSNKHYTVAFEKKVAKDLKKIEPKQREIIFSWIERVLDGYTNLYGIQKNIVITCKDELFWGWGNCGMDDMCATMGTIKSGGARCY